MIQSPVLFTAKNNLKFEIRTPREDEAQAALDMMVIVAGESPYILGTPESFAKRPVEGQVKWFQESAASDSAIILAVYHEGRMVGFCDARSYKDIKRKHRAGLGISILAEYRGCGLGRKLMEVLLENIKRFAGIQIIELDVMTNNQSALKLYESLGFKHAGVFPKAFILPTGEVSDNLSMYLEV
ncbi:GNAT family N-acetyltransferase [Bdellovibrio bacteriovorus]|uniref:GNAT family N-acetyltransferase n=1 Tax=Bdellovibrio bacteriovorus TaxID=959 RepID=UPI0021D18722|nr:GNAT family N-acetyltransferase [Bdellovibrio bacteriovorus]UXR63483.1 GNAT family N-acetyltransferase [Bdellovibrio bacteriovorus]